jgi:hypothetical protein
LIDYLYLKTVLAGELAQLAEPSARDHVQQLLLLLELITHAEYMQVRRSAHAFAFVSYSCFANTPPFTSSMR